jgi:hypothetical protein
MDGIGAFSILTLFNVLSTHSPLSSDRSVKSVLKFDITLLVTVLITIVIWVGIARIGSTIFLPIESGLAVLLTLGGIAATSVVVLMLIAHIIDDVEKHISKVLEVRHVQTEWDNTRKPILH